VISFILPFPPTVNHLTTVARGRKVNSVKARAYKQECALVMRGRREAIVGRVELIIELYPPDKRSRDASNYIKAVEDCMTEAGVWVDDSQVKRLVVLMFDPGHAMAGTCRVTASKIEE